VVVGARELSAIKEAVAQKNELTVDLEQLVIFHPGGLRVSFPFDPYAQETLVHGLDAVARTLNREGEIAAYEAAHPARVNTLAV